MATESGRVVPTGLSQAEPEEVSALAGFDPSRWRCVVNEMPPNCIPVLTIWMWGSGGGSLTHDVLWFDRGQWFDDFGEPADIPPTHWMPLPPAPAPEPGQ